MGIKEEEEDERRKICYPHPSVQDRCRLRPHAQKCGS